MKATNRPARWVVVFGVALLAAAPALSQPVPWQAAEEKKAAAAAEQWLSLVDQGKYAESWDGAAAYFRAAIPREKWAETMIGFRKPLGNLLERKLVSARFASTLPGAPDGSYVVLQFQSSFQNKKSAVETVTPSLEAGVDWRVSGYYIK